jgi:DNA-3-methyladenine glycosylase
MTPWENLQILPVEYYHGPTVDVARGLLGKVLVSRGAAGVITEVEAYLGLEDRAAHAYRGLTPRTRVLFGPPGRAYVYFIYGMYYCLNLVAEPEGKPGCVLIRAVHPVGGIAAMRRRRPNTRSAGDLASGPGKLTLAMGITLADNGRDVTRGPLTVRRLPEDPRLRIATTPRIGIRHCAGWPLRFVVEEGYAMLPSDELIYF